MTSDTQEQGTAPRGAKIKPRWARWWPVLLGLLAALLLLLWLFPHAASAHHLMMGGRLLKQAAAAAGDPDPAILANAIAHLETALRWHADNVEVYRLLSQAHLLQDNLIAAAQAAAHHAAAQPENTLSWWELAQIYEAMVLQQEATPTISPFKDLPKAYPSHPVAPALSPGLETLEQHTCVPVAQTEWTMPLALGSQLVGLEPMGEPVRRTVLLVQPSAQAERRVTIPAGAPVLTLWIGLDPLVWDLVRDVTTFQVAVDGEEVFGRALSVEEAWQGWWPAEVDLKRWIGQEVRLTLSTDAGPIGGACGYSAGWGDVQLVGTDAAPYVGLAPADRLRGAWHKAGFTDQDALQALDLAWQSARYDDLWAWRNALETPDEDLPPSLLFRLAISAVITGRELPSPLDPAVLTIHPVGDGVRIQAETLQWLQADPASGLDYGHRLADHPAPTPLEATMGQAGTVVAVVQVSEEADYQLTLRARHKTPEPGSLKLEHNLAPISEFSLTATWQEFTVTRTLTPGLHVIGIQYAQDGGDAILDWVQLEKLTGSLRTLGSQALVATLTKQRIGERLGPTRSD